MPLSKLDKTHPSFALQKPFVPNSPSVHMKRSSGGSHGHHGGGHGGSSHGGNSNNNKRSRYEKGGNGSGPMVSTKFGAAFPSQHSSAASFAAPKHQHHHGSGSGAASAASAEAKSLQPLSLGVTDPFLNGVGTVPLLLYPIAVAELYAEAQPRLRALPPGHSLGLGLTCCAVCGVSASQQEKARARAAAAAEAKAKAKAEAEALLNSSANNSGNSAGANSAIALAAAAAAAACGSGYVECPRCQRVEYCSQLHRRKDRKIHSAVCDALMQLSQDIAFARNCAVILAAQRSSDSNTSSSGTTAAPASTAAAEADAASAPPALYDPNDIHGSAAAAALLWRALLLASVHESRLRGLDPYASAKYPLSASNYPALVWPHLLPLSFGVVRTHWTWESVLFAPMRLAARTNEGPLPAPRLATMGGAATGNCDASANDSSSSSSSRNNNSSSSDGGGGDATGAIDIPAATAALLARPAGSLAWAAAAPAQRALTARFCCPLTIAHAIARDAGLEAGVRAVLCGEEKSDAETATETETASASASDSKAEMGYVAGVDKPARTLLLHVIGAADLETVAETVAYWSALPQAVARLLDLPLEQMPLLQHNNRNIKDNKDNNDNKSSDAANSDVKLGSHKDKSKNNNRDKGSNKSMGDGSEADADAAELSRFAATVSSSVDWRIRIIFIGPEIPDRPATSPSTSSQDNCASSSSSSLSQSPTVFSTLLPAGSPHLELAFYRGTYDAFLGYLDSALSPLPQSLRGPTPIAPQQKKKNPLVSTPSDEPAPLAKGPVAGTGSTFSLWDARPDLIAGFQMGLTVPEYDWGQTLTCLRGISGTSRAKKHVMAKLWEQKFPGATAKARQNAIAAVAASPPMQPQPQQPLSEGEEAFALQLGRRGVSNDCAALSDEARRRWVLTTSSSSEEALKEADILTGQCGCEARSKAVLNPFAALQPLQSATLGNDVWYKNAFVSLYNTGTLF